MTPAVNQCHFFLRCCFFKHHLNLIVAQERLNVYKVFVANGQCIWSFVSNHWAPSSTESDAASKREISAHLMVSVIYFYAATFDLTSCIAIGQRVRSLEVEPRPTAPTLQTLIDKRPFSSSGPETYEIGFCNDWNSANSDLEQCHLVTCTRSKLDDRQFEKWIALSGSTLAALSFQRFVLRINRLRSRRDRPRMER